jgi:alkylation response protein AidB-like acyl-CoA dehydrogenase
MSYRAPVRDIRFALEEIAALDSVKATGVFPEFSSDLTPAILDEAAKLANDVLAPLNWTGDQQGCTLKDGAVTTPDGFKNAYAQYVEGGWQGLQFSTDMGGMGLPKALGCALMEMLQSSNMAFGLGPMLSFGAIESLIAVGTDEQRELYLGKIMSGEWTATMNLTEPQAGSDLGALRTKAEPVGDGSWAIYGPEDLHHLGRARLRRQHRPPGAGAHCRTGPAGTKRHFAVPGAEILCRCDDGESLGERNDVFTAIGPRAQAGHSRLADLHHGSTATASSETRAPSAG